MNCKLKTYIKGLIKQCIYDLLTSLCIYWNGLQKHKANLELKK